MHVNAVKIFNFETTNSRYKLDGVAPLITDPPPTSFTTFYEKREKKYT